MFSLIADALLLVPIAHDLITRRQVHPIYLRVGALVVAIHMIELAAIDSRPWVQLARMLLGLPEA